MRTPVKKFNVKSFVICAAVLVSIFLVEVICAYAFGDDFSLDLSTTSSTKAVPDTIIDEYLDKGIDIDHNAVAGMIDQSEETGTKREYGKIAYKINTAPKFKKPDASGDIMIENHADNQHLIKVAIDEKLDSVTIYESGYIAPNMHIPSAPLDVEMEAGSYDCVAKISVYDMETLKLIGKLEKEISITIG